MPPTGGIFDLPGNQNIGADPANVRAQTLYDPSNAQFALQNAMLARGYNPFTGGIYNNYMQRLAPGLGSAFNIQQAMTPGLTQNDAGLGQPIAFEKFLNEILASGGAGRALQGASSAITGGGISSLVDQQRASLAGGGSLVNANPFITILEQMLGSGAGRGAVDVLQTLNSPFMNQGGARAYQQNLMGSLGNAIRGEANDPGLGTPEQMNSFLGFLLGQPSQIPQFTPPGMPSGMPPGGQAPGMPPGIAPNYQQGLPMPDPTRSMFGPFDPPGYRQMGPQGPEPWMRPLPVQAAFRPGGMS